MMGLPNNKETGSARLPARLKEIFAFWEEYDRWSPEERAQYLAQQEQETKQFEEEVLLALANQPLPITPDQFDEAADQIEKAAPNFDAVLIGIRALGKHYLKGRKFGLRPRQGSQRREERLDLLSNLPLLPPFSDEDKDQKNR